MKMEHITSIFDLHRRAQTSKFYRKLTVDVTYHVLCESCSLYFNAKKALNEYAEKLGDCRMIVYKVNTIIDSYNYSGSIKSSHSKFKRYSNSLEGMLVMDLKDIPQTTIDFFKSIHELFCFHIDYISFYIFFYSKQQLSRLTFFKSDIR